jgi:hypothetical protein
MMHADEQLSATVQLLNLTQHFLSPNLLVLGCRIAIMIQINAAGFIHPERSLLLLAFFVTLLNIVAGGLHLLEWSAGTLDGSGLILDFIGQSMLPIDPTDERSTAQYTARSVSRHGDMGDADHCSDNILCQQ